MKRIRVATYNVHRCRGLDGRTRPERVAAVLCEIDADIYALQEVVSIEGLAPEDDQASYLAESVGGTYAMGETRRHGAGAFGNVTISRRLRIEGWRHLDVSVVGRERRGVLRTDFRVASRPLHVFNIHLGTSWRERRRQAVRLVDSDLLRALDIEGARLVLGDLNEWTRGLVTRTLAAELQRAEPTMTPRRRAYPGILPFLQLDYASYDEHLTLEQSYYHRTRGSLVASDHLPLVAEFKVR